LGPPSDSGQIDWKSEEVKENMTRYPSLGMSEFLENPNEDVVPQQPVFEIHLERNDLVLKIGLSQVREDHLQINPQNVLLTIRKEKTEELKVKNILFPVYLWCF